jgi:hypothetical protein
MFLSNVLVRWYRSFNTLSLDREDADPFKTAIWTKVGKEQFPFVSLELDSKITTVVGANEAGKSHVLSALLKAFRAEAPTENAAQPYDKHDMCRYCGFDRLDTNYWPQFVVEFTATTAEEKATLKTLSGLGQEQERIWIHIDGSSTDKFARIHASPQNQPVKEMTKADWLKQPGLTLPEVRIIAADKALASEVHIKQLLNLYDNKPPGAAYDPMALQEAADSLRSLGLSSQVPPAEAAVAAYTAACRKLEQSTIGPTKSGQLETLLFRDVLEIPVSSLKEINEKSSSNPPSIYRLVADIQKRIDERLDLSRVWQQDPDLRLLVDFEAGLFFFRITDRTGIKYAFDERSSGLKYFLSYYIQALALERATAKRGMIILMDEPDGFLSATGQRNLLNVFENLVDDRRTRTRAQLVYTTHSPFLINKNFPHRVRLVRKGDGSEGTQVVDRSAYRRFEPIRTALGIDYADTLFVGSQNVVVEGPADQRLLTAGVQRFGRNLPIDALLDLNRVVFVTAGGAPRMKNIIARSIGGTDDNLPVVVALFDGDLAGAKACQEIEQAGLLAKDYLVSIDQLDAKNPHVAAPAVLEDLIPSGLLSAAVSTYARRRWDENASIAEVRGVLESDANGATFADRLKKIWSDKNYVARGVEQDVFRASVIEELAELLWSPEFGDAADLSLLQSNLGKVFSALTTRLTQASAAQSRQTAKKRINYFIREFKRAYAVKLTKANVTQYLSILRGECAGGGPELKQARDRIEQLQSNIDAEAKEADNAVNRDEWVQRLERFAAKPWG